MIKPFWHSQLDPSAVLVDQESHFGKLPIADKGIEIMHHSLVLV